MAIVLSADGSSRAILPASGESFSLKELQTIVGGYIEAVRLADGRYLILNEDGKRMSLPVNDTATRALHAAGGMPHDRVVGDCLIVSLKEMGE